MKWNHECGVLFLGHFINPQKFLKEMWESFRIFGSLLVFEMESIFKIKNNNKMIRHRNVELTMIHTMAGYEYCDDVKHVVEQQIFTQVLNKCKLFFETFFFLGHHSIASSNISKTSWSKYKYLCVCMCVCVCKSSVYVRGSSWFLIELKLLFCQHVWVGWGFLS